MMADRPKSKDKAGSRKKKKAGRRTHFVPVILVLVLAALVIAECVLFQGESITITGNQRVSDEEIEQLVHWDTLQGNTLLLWLLDRRVGKGGNEYLEDVEVRLDGPNQVEVTVTEVTLIGCFAADTGYYYCDEDGKAVFLKTERIEDVPLIEGLAVTLKRGKRIEAMSESALEDILEIGSLLLTYDIHCDSILVEDDDTYALQMGDVLVRLGRNVYMSERIAELADLTDELEGRKGTLHLEEYDSTKDSVIFSQE